MRCEPPMLPDCAICKPDTLPEIPLMMLGVWTRVSSSPETACCDVPIVAFSRCWLSAVTTTPVSCAAVAVSAKSCVIEPPESVTVTDFGWKPMRRADS